MNQTLEYYQIALRYSIIDVKIVILTSFELYHLIHLAMHGPVEEYFVMRSKKSL